MFTVREVNLNEDQLKAAVERILSPRSGAHAVSDGDVPDEVRYTVAKEFFRALIDRRFCHANDALVNLLVRYWRYTVGDGGEYGRCHWEFPPFSSCLVRERFHSWRLIEERSSIGRIWWDNYSCLRCRTNLDRMIDELGDFLENWKPKLLTNTVSAVLGLVHHDGDRRKRGSTICD